ncbi:diphosphomevalonate decarboxylase [Aerococcus sp. JJEM-2022b]|nr:diphosphomevalonate decarboxylase [Aerococcus mictus]MCY3077862.1 diphosphomevalonate decarboxylase [Aerococcus mictus]
MEKYRGICRAHTNIALIKYWGKRDDELILPMNSNLSLTLDRFYSETQISFSKDIVEDCFQLDGEWQDNSEVEKISRFVDLFRQLAQVDLACEVISYNHVPTAAGLASSASAFAALAGACNQALRLDLDPLALSRLARRGSGSATRSIFGGFVEWQKGTGDHDSQAVPFDDANWDVGMVVLALNTKKKAISSRRGMKHTVATSPFYQLWPQVSEKKLLEMKAAIKARDLDWMGEIAENHAMLMHATTLSADPAFTYLEAESLKAIEAVKGLRQQGYKAYFTMDAGPNVKILCPYYQSQAIIDALAPEFGADRLIASRPGPGIQYLEAFSEQKTRNKTSQSVNQEENPEDDKLELLNEELGEDSLDSQEEFMKRLAKQKLTLQEELEEIFNHSAPHNFFRPSNPLPHDPNDSQEEL